jgi:hypothetical protein
VVAALKGQVLCSQPLSPKTLGYRAPVCLGLCQCYHAANARIVSYRATDQACTPLKCLLSISVSLIAILGSVLPISRSNQLQWLLTGRQKNQCRTAQVTTGLLTRFQNNSLYYLNHVPAYCSPSALVHAAWKRWTSNTAATPDRNPVGTRRRDNASSIIISSTK